MRKATIPIDNDDECFQGFVVEYRVNGTVDYTRLYPDPIATPIVITGLLDDTLYDVRIKRKCCSPDGTESGWTETTVNTSLA